MAYAFDAGAFVGNNIGPGWRRIGAAAVFCNSFESSVSVLFTRSDEGAPEMGTHRVQENCFHVQIKVKCDVCCSCDPCRYRTRFPMRRGGGKSAIDEVN